MSSVYRTSTNSNITVAGLFDYSMVAHLVTLLSAIDKDGGQAGGQRLVGEVCPVLARVRGSHSILVTSVVAGLPA